MDLNKGYYNEIVKDLRKTIGFKFDDLQYLFERSGMNKKHIAQRVTSNLGNKNFMPLFEKPFFQFFELVPDYIKSNKLIDLSSIELEEKQSRLALAKMEDIVDSDDILSAYENNDSDEFVDAFIAYIHKNCVKSDNQNENKLFFDSLKLIIRGEHKPKITKKTTEAPINTSNKQYNQVLQGLSQAFDLQYEDYDALAKQSGLLLSKHYFVRGVLNRSSDHYLVIKDKTFFSLLENIAQVISVDKIDLGAISPEEKEQRLKNVYLSSYLETVKQIKSSYIGNDLPAFALAVIEFIKINRQKIGLLKTFLRYISELTRHAVSNPGVLDASKQIRIQQIKNIMKSLSQKPAKLSLGSKVKAGEQLDYNAILERLLGAFKIPGRQKQLATFSFVELSSDLNVNQYLDMAESAVDYLIEQKINILERLDETQRQSRINQIALTDDEGSESILKAYLIGDADGFGDSVIDYLLMYNLKTEDYLSFLDKIVRLTKD